MVKAPLSASLEPVRRRVTTRLSLAVLADVLVTYALLVAFTAGGAWLARLAVDGLDGGTGMAATFTAWFVAAAVALPVALANSLALHRLSLFIHAAAHWELAPTKEASDRAFRWLVAWFLGTNLDEHRTRHFAHHRKLGEPDDPEDFYSAPISWRRIARLLTARETFGRLPTGAESRSPFRRVALAVHLAIVVVLCLAVDPGYALVAWALPVLAGFPLMNFVRNYCEHHPLPGDPDPISRSFPAGLDAFFLGAAGFRWHTQHHETPGVHYLSLGRGQEQCVGPSYTRIFLELLRNR